MTKPQQGSHCNHVTSLELWQGLRYAGARLDVALSCSSDRELWESHSFEKRVHAKPSHRHHRHARPAPPRPVPSKQHTNNRRDEPQVRTRWHRVLRDRGGSLCVAGPWNWMTTSADENPRHALHRQRRVLQRRRLSRVRFPLHLGIAGNCPVHRSISSRRSVVSAFVYHPGALARRRLC